VATKEYAKYTGVQYAQLELEVEKLKEELK
jgi:hypothetical protein